MRLCPALWLGVLLVCASTTQAETWYVDVSSACPGQGTAASPFCSIQLAIAAAQPDDGVEVAPGTYLENIDFLGKRIVVRATTGPSGTHLDGRQITSCATFRNGEGPGSVLEGFTITNGSAPMGGGILIENASPTIRGNVIAANRGFDGAGIGVQGGAPLIDGNRIEDNWAITGSGGGIFSRSDATVRNNEVLRNRASGFSGGGGIACRDTGAPTIEGNRIESNTATVGAGVLLDRCQGALFSNAIALNVAEIEGGGLFMVDNDTRVVLNTVRANQAVRGAGINCGLACRSILAGNLIIRNGNAITTTQGGGLRSVSDSTPLVLNGTFANNAAAGGGGLWSSGDLIVVNTIVWGNVGGEILVVGGQLSVGTSIVAGGWPGPSNLAANPRFLAPQRDDYRISCSSPAREAGAINALLPPTDLEGDPRLVDGDSNGVPAVDIGADEFDFLWEPLGTLTGGSLLAFRTQAPPLEVGRVALVFLSFGDGTASGGIPLPGGKTLGLDPDALFLLALGAPISTRSASIKACPGSITQPVPIPANAPAGLRLYLAGILLGPNGSVRDVTPTVPVVLQ